jgi:hypothetical protein
MKLENHRLRMGVADVGVGVMDEQDLVDHGTRIFEARLEGRDFSLVERRSPTAARSCASGNPVFSKEISGRERAGFPRARE